MADVAVQVKVPWRQAEVIQRAKQVAASMGLRIHRETGSGFVAGSQWTSAFELEILTKQKVFSTEIRVEGRTMDLGSNEALTAKANELINGIRHQRKISPVKSEAPTSPPLDSSTEEKVDLRGGLWELRDRMRSKVQHGRLGKKPASASENISIGTRTERAGRGAGKFSGLPPGGYIDMVNKWRFPPIVKTPEQAIAYLDALRGGFPKEAPVQEEISEAQGLVYEYFQRHFGAF